MHLTIRIRHPRAGARFIHPLDPEPRTAILVDGFEESKRVRVFPHGWNVDAARFHPTSLAGPVEQLRIAARAGFELEHALVAFTYEGSSGLSHPDREWLWDAFGVPVFEQYLSAENQLLAMECDAHSGLHVISGCTDLDADYDACACGRALVLAFENILVL